MEPNEVITSQREGGLITVVPLKRITDFPESEVQEQCEGILEQIENPNIETVILDMSAVSYFGSTMIKWMVSVWKKLRDRQGKFIVCNLSPVGLEILETARFDKIWSIAKSKSDALMIARGEKVGS